MVHESKSMTTEGDRLSDLPDHLIHRIMSFLSPSEAAGLCVLSKRLLSAWLSFPELNLNSTNNYWDPCGIGFLNFAGNAIRRRRLTRGATLRSLRLNFYLNVYDAPHQRQVQELATAVLDEASELAIGQRVVNLTLICRSHIEFAEWNPLPVPHQLLRPLPDAVFSSRWIKSMVLSGLRLSPQELLVECPLLENFRLSSCNGATGVVFSGAAKLVKRVWIFHCKGLERIRISGSVSLWGFSYKGHRSSSNDQCQIDLGATSCESLKLLDISNCGLLTGEWLRDMAPKLVSLEKLVLKYCLRLESVRIDNERLKHLELKGTRKLVDVHVAVAGLETFMFDSGMSFHSLPGLKIDIEGCVRLRTLSIAGVATQAGWIEANVISNPFLENLSLSGCSLTPSSVPSSPLVLCRNLKNVELCLTTLFNHDHPNNNNEDEDQCRIHLRDFLYLVGHCNTMILSAGYSHEWYVFGENLRDMLSPALYGVKNLQIKVCVTEMTDSSPEELMDSFLWLAPSLHTLSFLHYQNSQPIFIIKFYYGEPNNQNASSSKASMAWKRDLANVVIESFDNDDDFVTSLHIYFAQVLGYARVRLEERRSNNPRFPFLL